jgi:anti-sigma B factor antagonist/stage II sporulation protein AA (anti-sigma F factor antagonist)
MSNPLYTLAAINGVQILQIHLPQQLDFAQFDTLNENLSGAIDSGTGSGRWVLDLSDVAYTGSAVLGLLVNLRQQIKSAGGTLALCGLSPQLLKALQTCSLDRLFKTAVSREQAMKALT